MHGGIDIKRFDIDPGEADQGLLGALLSHDQYRDHYAGGSPEQQGRHNLHGPYRLSAISVASFELITADEVRQVIQSWADEPETQTPEVQAVIDRQVYAILAGAVLYRLPDLRPTAQHDWGWVVGAGGFHEFVAIDRSASTLTLIVASDD